MMQKQLLSYDSPKLTDCPMYSHIEVKNYKNRPVIFGFIIIGTYKRWEIVDFEFNHNDKFIFDDSFKITILNNDHYQIKSNYGVRLKPIQIGTIRLIQLF
jgi:hypothetical protein